LVREIGQGGKVKVILGKALSILPETELLEQIHNLLHRGPERDIPRHGLLANTRPAG
jgi:hypothetical protein